jgi:hypothetical protein
MQKSKSSAAQLFTAVKLDMPCGEHQPGSGQRR